MNVKPAHVILVASILILLSLFSLIDTGINVQAAALNSNYEGFADGGARFVMYYADWCGHCQKAKPMFEGLIKSGGYKGAKFEMVSPEKEPEKAKGLDIQGFPTFILHKGDGSNVPYEGPREEAGIKSFLDSNM